MKKKIHLLSLCLLIMLSISGCGKKSEEIIAVEESINEIGTVTFESKEAILKAEESYAALDDKEKKKLENYDILAAARETFDNLEPIIGKWVFNKVVTTDSETLTKDDLNTPAEELANIVVDETTAIVSLYNSDVKTLTWEKVSSDTFDFNLDTKNDIYILGDKELFVAMPIDDHDSLFLLDSSGMIGFERAE